MSNCPTRRTHEVGHTKEPVALQEVAEGPWQKLAVDLFTHDGKGHLITLDYFIDDFVIDAMLLTSAHAAVSKLRGHFARGGILKEVVSNNEPRFTAEEFRAFSKRWKFSHYHTSPPTRS